MQAISGVARILMGVGHSDDTMLVGSGGILPRTFFEIGSLKRLFLHFEGTFEQNI